ncbi:MULTISPECIES: hypothetical protein [unclassified Oscillibacter]|uniref:hypothetical protein n=1 Tax=unclassified Oscillibacter TaxID=2629304 RepID=UPI0025CCE65B|nr:MULTISPECIES: hypothetical protein [unclassified Oscillibacter]
MYEWHQRPFPNGRKAERERALLHLRFRPQTRNRKFLFLTQRVPACITQMDYQVGTGAKGHAWRGVQLHTADDGEGVEVHGGGSNEVVGLGRLAGNQGAGSYSLRIFRISFSCLNTA